MNVYDFDKTIYYKDSTYLFYLDCIKKYPFVWTNIFRTGWYWLLYKLNIVTKRRWKSEFYKFFTLVPNLDQAVNEFWETNRDLIKPFYREIQREDDLIISASSNIVINPICKILNIKNILTTEVDPKTGRLLSEHCYGEEKVKRFTEAGYKPEDVEEFYSDSYSDTPLAKLAKRAYIVKKDDITDWKW